MIMQRPQTEQPQENQSSFGPSNQQSSFAGDSGSDGSSWTADGNSGWASGKGSISNSSALPWQQNDMGQQTQPYQPKNLGMNGQPQQVDQQEAPAPQGNQSWSVGHNDQTPEGWNREQWRDAWQGYGASNNQMMDQFLAAHGGQRMNDSGVVRTPYGEMLDIGTAYKTGHGSAGWNDIGLNTPQQQAGAVFSGPTNQNFNQFPQGQNFQQGPNTFNSGNQPMNGGMSPQLYQQLMTMMQGGGAQIRMQNQNPVQNFQYGRPDLFNTANSNQMDISQLLGQNQGTLSGPSGIPQGPMTTRNGQYVPANPGDMISNGWGGYKPYDPNSTSIS
jgi:hypothetical protein